jgi:hypothetical protein
MHRRYGRAAVLWAAIVLVSVLGPHDVVAQKKVLCADGEHLEIDLEQVSIQYNTSSFSATLNGLGLLGGRVQVDQKKLQEAAASTQQWNEYLKGLILGYNACAITKQKYAEGITRIYPRLQQDAADLEAIRKLIAEGRKADEKRLQTLIDSYLSNLGEFKKVAAPRDDLRERGLQLCAQITDFLTDRQGNDPHPEQAPAFHGASGGGADKHGAGTPKYMRETLALFGDKFETRIADIRDELLSRGLQDLTLNALYRDSAHDIFGNVDAAIKEMADSIHKLVLLVPPQGLYKSVSDANLAQIVIEEADRMDEMTKDAMNKMQASSSPDSVRLFFEADFRDCCLNQVEYLRAELMKRLGPSAYDTPEMSAFNGHDGLTEMEKNPSGSIATVLEYVPHFRRLGIRLKRKATPLAAPRALSYSETRVASDNSRGPYKIVVTINTNLDLIAGYIIVKFAGRYTSMGCDMADAKMIVGSRDVIDNPEVDNLLLEWTLTTPIYAFKIGKTPFLSSRPIHVVADAPEELHAVKVVFVDE